MIEVISVRFRGGCKTYYFAPGELKVRMGDQVIVETAQGLEFATVSEGNHDVPESAVVSPLSTVLRRATEADIRTVEQNRKKEREAFDVCEKKIAEHGLDMKLVNVSASFDGSKILFFFTADGRVDFRELVRDLASVFRSRIELRQIGVRDEAKMIGGLGICGRPFCCSEFLDGFMPVSIKMAKTQNLSLNPAKISGTCGRLMCCLKYEQHAYEDAAKRMPKVESFVQTPDGPGNVKSVDLLRETMKVSLDSATPSEPFKCYHNCEVCVLRNGKGSREGIAIPERPDRFVDQKQEEDNNGFEILDTPPFYMHDRTLEEAPMREKIGGAASGDGKSRRHHRGGRKRPPNKNGDKSAEAKNEPGKQAQQGGKPQQGGKNASKGGKPQQGGERPSQKQTVGKPRPPKAQGSKKPQQGGKSEGEKAAAPKTEGGDAKRHRPHHRGGRRRSKSGSSGNPAPSKE